MASASKPSWKIRVARRFAVLLVVSGLSWGIAHVWRLRRIDVDLALPAELGPLKDQKPGPYLTRVNDLPPSVVRIIKTMPSHPWLPDSVFPMADGGARWNPTDVIYDKTLPTLRLIWATEVNQYYIVYYESGGIGHSYRFNVFSPEKDGLRAIIWSGASANSFVWSAAGFAQGVAANRIGDPRYWPRR